jgi:DNA-directed RNA polymerase subunit RPC12/RpoP
MNVEEKEVAVGQFGCTNCGADLKYKPGTQHLVCGYCGTDNEIPDPGMDIEELDFHAYLNNQASSEPQFTEQFVKCQGCGASSSLDPKLTSASCPYCDTALVVEQAKEESILQPKSLLPFKLSMEEAKKQFKKWIDGLWFAPGNLKKAALNFDHFKGIYIPYWTYDTKTQSAYIGQRGTYYYVTETYTENGQTRTRSVRKTRWTTVTGEVKNDFDDILVPATRSLPQEYIEALEPWDLPNLAAFEKRYLSGFLTEKYQVGLAEGFERAKQIAEKSIRSSVHRSIGGDEQRITTLSTQWNNITFKHLLLPVYVSAYRFNNKLYQFLVNARTGEVQGQRPWSWAKIAGLVLLIIAIIAAIMMLAG